MTIFRRILLALLAAVLSCSVLAASLAPFNPGLTYTTVTDIQGSIYAYQNGYYYDQQGNAFLTIPHSKNGYTAVSASSGSSFTGSYGSFTATNSISAASNVGVFSYGTLSYTDANLIGSFVCSVNNYCQSIWQNLNAGALASTDIVVSNNLGTATTYYANFGINSSGFTGSGSFNLPNASYMSSTSGDLVIGTTTNNIIRFVINGATTDAADITANGITEALNLYGGTTSQMPYQSAANTTLFVTPVAVSQDVTCTSGGACTVTQIQNTAVSTPTGSGSVMLSNGPTLTGPLYFASGRTGTFVCTSGGSITVTNANILATSNVVISTSVPGGTVSTTPNIKTLTASTSFVVLCATLDTSTYNYAIIN